MLDATPLVALFLAVAANFVAQTLPCSTRRMLAHPAAKLVIVWVLLVVSISYTSGEKSFKEALRSSAPVFGLFFLATLVDAPYLVTALVLLLVGLVLSTELKQNRIKGGEEAVRRARRAAEACNAGAVLVLLTGAALYWRRQRRDHARDWSWLKFFSLKCRRGT
jgi:K+-sensing histidine kinase KdpD